MSISAVSYNRPVPVNPYYRSSVPVNNEAAANNRLNTRYRDNNLPQGPVLEYTASKVDGDLKFYDSDDTAPEKSILASAGVHVLSDPLVNPLAYKLIKTEGENNKIISPNGYVRIISVTDDEVEMQERRNVRALDAEAVKYSLGSLQKKISSNPAKITLSPLEVQKLAALAQQSISLADARAMTIRDKRKIIEKIVDSLTGPQSSVNYSSRVLSTVAAALA